MRQLILQRPERRLGIIPREAGLSDNLGLASHHKLWRRTQIAIRLPPIVPRVQPDRGLEEVAGNEVRISLRDL